MPTNKQFLVYTPVHFTEREFNAASPSCSLEHMNPDFLARLDEARTIAGIPFIVNSAYRSREHELSKGRSGIGMHTQGRAVDIMCTNSQARAIIVSAALQAGIRGIGIANTFVHLDDRKDAKMWLY